MDASIAGSLFFSIGHSTSCEASISDILVSVFTLAIFSSPTRMGFVFYDIFLRCILLYLFASNVLLSILTLEWLNYLQATVFRILRLL